MKLLARYYLAGYGEYKLWGNSNTIKNSSVLMGGLEFDPDDGENGHEYEIWDKEIPFISSIRTKEEFLNWWHEKKEICLNSQRAVREGLTNAVYFDEEKQIKQRFMTHCKFCGEEIEVYPGSNYPDGCEADFWCCGNRQWAYYRFSNHTEIDHWQEGVFRTDENGDVWG